MSTLPDPVAADSPTVQAIYDAYARKTDKPRRYLGASIIGKPCARALWYEFRWCGREEFSGRLLRLFQSGHLEEIRLIHNLRDIGCEVHEVDPVTGQQFGVSSVAGHFRGHMDGAVTGVPGADKTWHVLECKTHNAKSFKALQAKGVQAAKPEHYAQIQVYMHLSGMDRALYLAQNKDTDELYAERVRLDKAEAEKIIERAKSIIAAATPPEKIADDRDAFACKWCAHKDRCHGSTDVDAPAVQCRVTCRSCIHATPVMEGDAGSWRCDRHGKSLSEPEQEKACPDHLFIPDLITFAAAMDSGKDEDGHQWVLYEGEGRQPWTTGRQKGAYSSIELTVIPVSAVGAGMVDEIKQRFGAEAKPADECPI